MESTDATFYIVGHCNLRFDSTTGKFSAVYDRDLAYGSFTDVFYQVDRDFGTDQSKRTLGLLVTDAPNLFWQTNMAPRPFPNIFLSTSTGTPLIHPFNSSIFESPLTHVSELKLTTDLETASTNSIGLQFTLAEKTTFTEGTVALIGDTLKLQSETLSSPLASTYTISGFLRRISQTTAVYFSRWFYWNAIDTPSQVITKWNDMMRPFANGNSFGHLALTYDTGFGWFSMHDGSDPSKDNLGLNRTPSAINPGWTAGDPPKPFPYAAGYFQEVVKIGLFITGSTGTIHRQVDFDISQSASNNSTISEKYTMIINHLNEVSFFAGATEIIRDAEAGYPRLWGLIFIRSVHRCNHTGLFGKTENGSTMNVVNSIERIEDTLYKVQENINIVSCTATSDSWLLTTDNPGGNVQLNVIPAYSTEDVEVFTSDSPSFINNINITTSQDWNNSEGWRILSSSTFQNNAAYAANAGFDKKADTYWGSSDGTFTSAGVGSQSLTIEYPRSYKLSSLRFEGSTRYPGVTAPTAWTLAGSNDTTFTDIQSYEKTNWVANQSLAFDVTAEHVAYRYYRVTFTRVTAGSGSTYVSVPDLTFITVQPIGAHVLSVQPVSTNSFKIIVGSADGRIMSMINSPMTAWRFFITIIKGGRIVNSGLYTLSSTGFTKMS
ncbi:hypothetical protein T492DRAFT_831929 [Pavlovales sp. CCMP2436]|nr:hypothetical protein T492DRAFT_831929 [Pavlovales sp. CCMP2436]